MNTLQIHEIGFGILPETRKRRLLSWNKNLKQDIQIGETIRSLRMERKLTQDQVVSKLQLMDLDITRSIYSQIEGGTYSIRISVLAGLARSFRWTIIPSFGTSIFQVQNNSTFQTFRFLFVLTVAHILPGFARNLARFCDCARKFPRVTIGTVKIICSENAAHPKAAASRPDWLRFSCRERRFPFNNFIWLCRSSPH